VDPWRQAPYKMGGKSQLASPFDLKFEFVRVLDPTRNLWVGSLGAKPAPNPPRARVGAGWIRVNPTRSAQSESVIVDDFNLYYFF